MGVAGSDLVTVAWPEREMDADAEGDSLICDEDEPKTDAEGDALEKTESEASAVGDALVDGECDGEPEAVAHGDAVCETEDDGVTVALAAGKGGGGGERKTGTALARRRVPPTITPAQTHWRTATATRPRWRSVECSPCRTASARGTMSS